MDYDTLEWKNGDVALCGIRAFDLKNTLDSGQCFRWRELGENRWEGIAHGRRLTLSVTDGKLLLHETSPREFEAVWRDYFDLGRDYGELARKLRRNPVLRRATGFAPGIRVLRQEPFEALCSFILSQNNNVKRIRGLVERLCELAGEPVEGGFAFPTPESIAALDLAGLEPIRAGFRAKYLLAAAKAVASGGFALEPLYTIPLEEARERLTSLYGVGRKVADCVLLYGFARTECIPEDVWMKRVLAQFYPEGFPRYLSKWGGIAQQSLFHYARCCEGAVQK